MAKAERWTPAPAPHDYPAALDYLTLLFDDLTARALVSALQRAPMTTRKAKDLLRASHLPLLPAIDHEVQADLKKVRKGQRLSPVLLVRGDGLTDRPLIVADGYHRICASYSLDDDADIPCRIAPAPLPRPGRGRTSG